MKIKIYDLNLLIKEELRNSIPRWFRSDLEFDFPYPVKAGLMCLIKEYEGKVTIGINLWKSENPPNEEPRCGEVIFINKGTDESPDVESAARMVEDNMDPIQKNATRIKELLNEYPDKFIWVDSEEKASLIDHSRNCDKSMFEFSDPSLWKYIEKQLKSGKEVAVVGSKDLKVVTSHIDLFKKKEKSGDGKCFIATAVYESYDAPEVLILREFRDTYLTNNIAGTVFCKIYYCISPFFASLIIRSIILKSLVKKFILGPIVKIMNAFLYR